MSICLLSDEEVGRLINYNIEPSHTAHRHITMKQAARMFNQGRITPVEHNGQHYAQPTKLYVLAPRKSGGSMPVIQRVRGVPLKHIQPPTMLDLEPMP